MLKKSLFALLVLLIYCFAVAAYGALAGEISLSPEQLRVPGVYSLENDPQLIAVGSGRIAQTLGAARAERLAGEQALRDAKKRLALHLFATELNGPARYSVQIAGARVLERIVENDRVYVALLAAPDDVSLAPRNPLDDFHDVQAAPIVGELLTRMPTIADGGGMFFDMNGVNGADGGWAAMGVGYAALPDTAAPEAVRKAQTVARVTAAEALAGFIYGVQVEASSEQHSVFAESPAGAVFEEWSKNKTREEIAGILSGAQTAGQWITDDEHIGVAVLVGEPPLDLAGAMPNETPASDSSSDEQGESSGEQVGPLLHKSDIDAAWQRILLARPWILSGGTSLCKHEGILYAIAVESGALKGNTAYDRVQLPTMLDVKARNQLTRYLLGFSSKTVTQSEESRFTDLQSETVTESLSKVSHEGAAGVVSGIKRLGSWYSEDEKTLFQAFAVPIP